MLLTELNVLQRVDHQNLIRVLEIFEDDKTFFIVSELIEGGDLHSRLQAVGNYNEQQAATIIHQILLAVNFLHKIGIMHRDLKPGNILMCTHDADDLSLKLTDFGFSSFYDTQKDILGTPLYMAPEIFKKKRYTSKVDIWSIGIITYKLLVGKSPFGSINQIDQLSKHIKTKGMQLPQEFYNQFSPEAVDFMEQTTKLRAA